MGSATCEENNGKKRQGEQDEKGDNKDKKGDNETRKETTRRERREHELLYKRDRWIKSEPIAFATMSMVGRHGVHLQSKRDIREASHRIQVFLVVKCTFRFVWGHVLYTHEKCHIHP